MVQLRKSFAEEPRAEAAAVANLLFLFVRPAQGVKAFACEMNDGVETFQRGGTDASRIGLPWNRVFEANARVANQPDDDVAASGQKRNQRGSDQAGRTADENFQRSKVGPRRREPLEGARPTRAT